MNQTIDTTTIPASNAPRGRTITRNTARASPTDDTALRSHGPKASAAKTDLLQLKKSVRQKESGGRDQISKADIVLKKLRLVRGVTIAQMVEVTGWQAHSVRGFLSAIVRKKLRLDLMSEVGRDGLRRYRIVERDNATE